MPSLPSQPKPMPSIPNTQYNTGAPSKATRLHLRLQRRPPQMVNTNAPCCYAPPTHIPLHPYLRLLQRPPQMANTHARCCYSSSRPLHTYPSSPTCGSSSGLLK